MWLWWLHKPCFRTHFENILTGAVLTPGQISIICPFEAKTVLSIFIGIISQTFWRLTCCDVNLECGVSTYSDTDKYKKTCRTKASQAEHGWVL